MCSKFHLDCILEEFEEQNFTNRPSAPIYLVGVYIDYIVQLSFFHQYIAGDSIFK